MKKILIRSGMSPLDIIEPEYIIARNLIGGNVGNLLYQYGVFRALTTDEIELVPDNYKIDHNEADYINETYECYIIPLADAFRESFRSHLRRYTKLIKKLKIPVVVIGVGLRAPFEPKLDEGFPFDDDVKNFVSAVLEKSSMIGVRGQITADYLTKLGFREGIDHIVIGCPSMYSFGSQIKIRDTIINKDSLISVNSSLLSQEKVLKFISKTMEEYPNHYFIPQWRKEMMLTYVGSPPIRENSKYYPADLSHPVYKNGRVKFFLNAPTWIEYMKKVDLSFGARLHGNIAATLAGTPSLIIPKDARMRELAEYHNLTSLWWKDIDESTRLEEVLQKVDFKSPEKVQKENFERFISFLEKNNLEHAYKENHAPDKIPLDKKLEQLNLLPPIEPFSTISSEEKIDRLRRFYEAQEEVKIERLRRKYEIKLHDKDKEIEHLEGTLNRKLIRLALGFADGLSKIKSGLTKNN